MPVQACRTKRPSLFAVQTHRAVDAAVVVRPRDRNGSSTIGVAKTRLVGHLIRPIGRAGLGRVLDDRGGNSRSGFVGRLGLERRIAGWCGLDLRRDETRQDQGAADALAAR